MKNVALALTLFLGYYGALRAQDVDSVAGREGWDPEHHEVLTELKRQVRLAEERVGSIQLVAGRTDEKRFSCGRQATWDDDGDGVWVMYGSLDGTACGVENKNYFKRLDLQMRSSSFFDLQSDNAELDRLIYMTKMINERLDGVELSTAEFKQDDFVCGQEKVRSDGLWVMWGSFDGTGCWKPNVNFFKRLDLFVPPHKGEALEAEDPEINALARRIAMLNSRLNGLRLEVAASDSQEYTCSHEAKKSESSLWVMHGLRDGTGCDIPNRNYFKRLALRLP